MASNMRNRKKPKPRQKTPPKSLLKRVGFKTPNQSAFGLRKNAPQQNNPKATAAKPTSKETPNKKNAGPLASRSYKKTKGGDYPVYKKSSPEAGSFRAAYSAARKAKAAGKSVKANARTGFSYDAKTNMFTHKGRKFRAETEAEKNRRLAKSRSNTGADLSSGKAPKRRKPTNNPHPPARRKPTNNPHPPLRKAKATPKTPARRKTRKRASYNYKGEMHD